MDPKLYKAVTFGTRTNWSRNIIPDLDSTSVQVTCGQGSTILHVAAKSGNKWTAKRILNGRPWLAYETNMKGDTPLHIASRLGHLEMATLLMNHYEEVSTHAILEAGTDPLHMVNREKNTVLHEAARNGCLDIVKLLIQKDRSWLLPRMRLGNPLSSWLWTEDIMTAVSAFWKLFQIAQSSEEME